MNSRLQLAALTALLGLACGGTDPGMGSGGGDGAAGGPGGSPAGPVSASGGPASRSGSRLKLRSLQSEDGAQLITGLFDSKYQVPCTPGRTSDDVLRCLPAVSNLDLNQIYPVSLQPDCSNAQSGVPESTLKHLDLCQTGSLPLLFIIRRGTNTCAAADVYEYWLATQEAQTVYWNDPYKSDHPCTKFGAMHLISRIPETDFVRLTDVVQ